MLVMEPELNPKRDYSYKIDHAKERYHTDPAYRARVLAQSKAYRARNLEKCKARSKAYRNGPAREKLLEAKRKDHAEKMAADPNFRKDYFNRPDVKARKREYDRKRRAEQADKLSAQQRAWREANSDHLNAYCRKKRKTDPQYAVANNMRCRLNIALRSGGLRRDKPLAKLIGCSIVELMAHLERQFQPGMSWENRGHRGDVWHVDHVKPCSSFDLTDPVQRAECFHYTNLQPLWAVENIRKGGVRKRRAARAAA